jgi:hypothetical protein
MNSYENDLLPATAASIVDVSNGVVLVLCALIMTLPFVMLVGLVYSGIRDRRRTSSKEPSSTQTSKGDAVPDRNDQELPEEGP